MLLFRAAEKMKANSGIDTNSFSWQWRAGLSWLMANDLGRDEKNLDSARAVESQFSSSSTGLLGHVALLPLDRLLE